MAAAFSLISPTSAALAVVAVGTLFALHHLKAQPVRRAMATLLFWREAIQPNLSRVPWAPRFTHRKTFALLAAIVGLLCAALTADRWGSLADSKQHDVIVIDAGDAMAAEGGEGRSRLRHAIDAARADLTRLMGVTPVIAAAAQPLPVSREGEPNAVTIRRLGELTPQAGASASALAIRLAGSVQGGNAGSIHWYTAAREVPVGLPSEVARRVVIHSIAAGDGVAIVGVTFQSNAEDAQRGTLTVRVAGKSSTAFALNATAIGKTTMTRAVPAVVDQVDVTFENVIADGSSMAFQLAGSAGASAVHPTQFRLPDQRPLTFRFQGKLPESLKAALLASGAASADGVIVVTDDSTPVPADAKAAITVVSKGPPLQGGQLLSFVAGSGFDERLSLERARSAAGPELATVGKPLLLAGGKTVGGLDESNGRKSLYLSSALFDTEAELPKRAAFPVLVNRLCRDLAGRTLSPMAIASLRAAEDPLWRGPLDGNSQKPAAAFVAADHPPATGEVAATGMELAGRFRGQIRWTEAVLSAALGLLVIEGLLFAVRKVV